MNKDKSIKDLKERNNKLVYQLDTTKIRETVNLLRCERLQEAKDKLQKDYQEAVDKINELQQIIDKAIEYINNREWEDYPLQIAGHHKLKEEKEGKDLLEILRGDK